MRLKRSERAEMNGKKNQKRQTKKTKKQNQKSNNKYNNNKRQTNPSNLLACFSCFSAAQPLLLFLGLDSLSFSSALPSFCFVPLLFSFLVEAEAEGRGSCTHPFIHNAANRSPARWRTCAGLWSWPRHAGVFWPKLAACKTH